MRHKSPNRYYLTVEEGKQYRTLEQEKDQTKIDEFVLALTQKNKFISGKIMPFCCCASKLQLVEQKV